METIKGHIVEYEQEDFLNWGTAEVFVNKDTTICCNGWFKTATLGDTVTMTGEFDKSNKFLFDDVKVETIPNIKIAIRLITVFKIACFDYFYDKDLIIDQLEEDFKNDPEGFVDRHKNEGNEWLEVFIAFNGEISIRDVVELIDITRAYDMDLEETLSEIKAGKKTLEDVFSIVPLRPYYKKFNHPDLSIPTKRERKEYIESQDDWDERKKRENERPCLIESKGGLTISPEYEKKYQEAKKRREKNQKEENTEIMTKENVSPRAKNYSEDIW